MKRIVPTLHMLEFSVLSNIRFSAYVLRDLRVSGKLSSDEVESIEEDLTLAMGKIKSIIDTLSQPNELKGELRQFSPEERKASIFLATYEPVEQQPASDVDVLIEALEQVIKAAPSSGPLWYGSEQIAEARAVLTALSKEGEQPASSHDWDDQDKCRRCGDRDWYASATCTPKY